MEKINKNKAAKISNSKDLLMLSLSKFYTRQIVSRILPIIEGESNISLRLIDWFVTNYSKKYNTVITKQQNNNIIHFNVYLSYRSQLKAYSKQLFDPFRRRDRITFYFDKESSIETTIGQLNFFRWIISNDILEYINSNLKDIENDMIKVQKDNQTKKNNEENIKVKVVQTDEGVVIQKRKKRIQLSKSSIKNMNLLNGQRTIQFD
jgi:hypothetical protein